jgi:U4/U6 small nuclear ribonucleoprotein SNU13
MADAALTQELLDLLQQAMHYDQVKKGANEGMYFHNSFSWS